VHVYAIHFLFSGFATCFGGGEGSRRGYITIVGKAFIASSSRSMLSRTRVPKADHSATTVDDPLDDEELEYRLGDVVLIISSSVVPRTFVRLGLATHVG
jgi:hypothetical protein